MKCHVCGADLPDDANFCPQCGFVFDRNDSQNTSNGNAFKNDSSAQNEVHYEQTVIHTDEVFEGFGGSNGSNQTRYCTSCGRPLAPGAQFCNGCGARVDSVEYCTNCGRLLEPGLEYCRNCGARVGGDTYAPQSVGFIQAFKLYWKKYFTFSGRATRSEFWFVFLWQIIIGVALGIVQFATNADMMLEALLGMDGAPQITPAMIAVTIIVSLWDIVNIIPMAALIVRRLHDTGRSGGWFFIQLIPGFGTLILYIGFLTQPSQYGINQYDTH